MVQYRLNSRHVKWAVTLLEMGFPESRVEEAVVGCSSLEEAIQKLLGIEDSGDAGADGPASAAA
eukprot:CAMPEP_0203866090 /NCGR_PEP_ID=MMETSP0359-20131031/15738_1 /ASSEMBLY_ACC=CAM_ASM_000338 /TAXON_ID=268821 /ORGANISM="Scrippsiella Hangoei, Strain SHTV-5" /LENGTH=63 /DNA_ID=CAMNT_0050784115 /DNA_START=103 /DNA_END=290 /DNA_ORIENTATION=+